MVLRRILGSIFALGVGVVMVVFEAMLHALNMPWLASVHIVLVGLAVLAAPPSVLRIETLITALLLSESLTVLPFGILSFMYLLVWGVVGFLWRVAFTDTTWRTIVVSTMATLGMWYTVLVSYRFIETIAHVATPRISLSPSRMVVDAGVCLVFALLVYGLRKLFLKIKPARRPIIVS